MSWVGTGAAVGGAVLNKATAEEPSVTTTQQPTRTKKQRQALQRLIDELGGGRIETQGVTEGEQSVLDEILGRTQGQQALVGDAQSRIGELLGSRDEFDEFFETNVEQPLMENFQEEVIPGIGRRFGGANFFSSERRDAEQDAMEELAQQLTAGRSQAAIQAPMDAVSSLGEVFGAQRGLDDMALKASGFERQVREKQRRARVQEILNALGQESFENITTVDPGSAGVLGSDFGSIAASGIRAKGRT